MLENDQAVHLLADTLEGLGVPLGLPEDWIILNDDDDLRWMPRPTARRLLVKAKGETARRWLYARFDPSEVELALREEYEDNDDAVDLEWHLLRQRAIKSIDDVMSEVESFREVFRRRIDKQRALPYAI